jgi:transposase
MEKQDLLIDCNIKAIKERLKTTLANIEIQKGVMMWDDKEKIEHCIYALQILEEEEKEIKRLEEQLKYQKGLGNKGRAEILKDYINKLKNKNK